MNPATYRYEASFVRGGAGDDPLPEPNRRVPRGGGPPEPHLIVRIDQPSGTFILRKPVAGDHPAAIREPGGGPSLDER